MRGRFTVTVMPWKLRSGSRRPNPAQRSRNTPSTRPRQRSTCRAPSRKARRWTTSPPGGVWGRCSKRTRRGWCQAAASTAARMAWGVSASIVWNVTVVPWGEGAAAFRMDVGAVVAEEVLRGEVDAPWVVVITAAPRRDRTAAAREAEQPHAGGVLAAHEVLAPPVRPEGEQDVRRDDARAVVVDDDGVADLDGVARERDADTRGAGAAGVLEELGEDIAEGCAEHARHAAKGVGVDVGADGGRSWIDRRLHVELRAERRMGMAARGTMPGTAARAGIGGRFGSTRARQRRTCLPGGHRLSKGCGVGGLGAATCGAGGGAGLTSGRTGTAPRRHGPIEAVGPEAEESVRDAERAPERRRPKRKRGGREGVRL